MQGITEILVGGALLALAAFAGFEIVKVAQAFSNAMFGVRSFRKGLELQAERLAATPKSVSGMTKVFLPQIAKDFPQFNLFEFRQKAENALKTALLAISRQEPGLVSGLSADLAGQVRLTIENDLERGMHTHYEHVRVHRTEISGYRKQEGTCAVTLQSAVEYLYYVTRAGETPEAEELVSGSRERPLQTKYNLELLYIQDPVKAGQAGSGLGISCPHCGAPVTGLGQKQCAYCGLAVTEINLHVWSLSKFYEVKN